jgi:hypothetical protein
MPVELLNVSILNRDFCTQTGDQRVKLNLADNTFIWRRVIFHQSYKNISNFISKKNTNIH